MLQEAPRADSSNPLTSFGMSRMLLQKVLASGMMSSRRSRSGGNAISIVFNRKSKSCESGQRHFIMQIRVRGRNDSGHLHAKFLDEPTRSNSPASITRSNFA